MKHGTFATFNRSNVADIPIGVKKYSIKDMVTGMLCHAINERYFLEGLTQLVEKHPSCWMDYLGSHVAKFHCAWIEGGIDGKESLCLLMDLVNGRELNEELARGIAEEKTLKITCELLQTLAILHEIGVCHRDLKFDNIMIDRDGTPVLIDWGTACSSGVEKRTVCGSRRSNSLQVLALEAHRDGKLSKDQKARIFSKATPSYSTRANDVVQFAHMICGLWTSRTSNGSVCCSAFGPAWDEFALNQPAHECVTALCELYGSSNKLAKASYFSLIPQPLRTIVVQCIPADENKRISLLAAWRYLRKHPVLIGPSKKRYDLRDYLPKPPLVKDLAVLRKDMAQILKEKLPRIDEKDATPELVKRCWPLSSGPTTNGNPAKRIKREKEPQLPRNKENDVDCAMTSRSGA